MLDRNLQEFVWNKIYEASDAKSGQCTPLLNSFLQEFDKMIPKALQDLEAMLLYSADKSLTSIYQLELYANCN